MTYSEFMMLCMALAEEYPEILDYQLVFRVDREDLALFIKDFAEHKDADALAMMVQMGINERKRIVCITHQNLQERYSETPTTIH